MVDSTHCVHFICKRCRLKSCLVQIAQAGGEIQAVEICRTNESTAEVMCSSTHAERCIVGGTVIVFEARLLSGSVVTSLPPEPVLWPLLRKSRGKRQVFGKPRREDVEEVCNSQIGAACGFLPSCCSDRGLFPGLCTPDVAQYMTAEVSNSRAAVEI